VAADYSTGRRHEAAVHLVGHNPADVFEDVDQLRGELILPAQRRSRATETFARIPHDKGLALDVSGTAWRVLIELDRLILKAGGRNPISLSSKRLRAIGLISGTRMRALRRLQAAGVIKVKQRGRGHGPWVFHTWYPKQS
jgi:hypothetical protein